MNIEVALLCDIHAIAELDCHIPADRLAHCIQNENVMILKDGRSVAGVFRYSLFWQTIPFLDLIFLAEPFRHQGYGTQMMERWENDMKRAGYTYVMTSTQADEDAWRFYEKRGYHRSGGFFPPDQEAEEWIYLKKL